MPMKRTKSIALLKALADETRLELLHLLKERPRYGEELAAQLKLTASTVSFHLGKLEQAGLVCRAKDQYYILFSLNEPVLDQRLRDLVAFTDTRAAVLDTRLEAYKRKVLSAFMRGGRLTQLPTQKKKRLIVLEHFAQRFAPGRTYSEAEVDRMIEEGFSDYCTIRRELVDERFMERRQGIYRRIPPAPGGAVQGAAEEHKAEIEKEQTTMESYKDIKARYKQTPRTAGVFQIRNTATGRFFLGSSINLHGPWNRHRFALTTGVHPNKELQKDWNEYGADAFLFEVLETVKEDPDVDTGVALEALEKAWTVKLDPYGPRGYNPFNVVKGRLREA